VNYLLICPKNGGKDSEKEEEVEEKKIDEF
jgi:hypothetical protein